MWCSKKRLRPCPAHTRRPTILLTLSARGCPAVRCSGNASRRSSRTASRARPWDVAHTLAVGRTAFRTVASLSAATRLKQSAPCAPRFRRAESQAMCLLPSCSRDRAASARAWLRRLYGWAPVFRTEIDRCIAILQPNFPDLNDLLLSSGARRDRPDGPRPAGAVHHVLGARPSMDALGCAAHLHDRSQSGRTRRRHGRRSRQPPRCAAPWSWCAAGLMQAARPGAMLAVALSEAELSLLRCRARCRSRLSTARAHAWLAAPRHVSMIFGDRLTKEGVAIARLATSHAFHSAAMDERTCRLQGLIFAR